MAAAEARAVWQRTANRYFVQEDAKRAPKLACCQSSATSTKQIDSGPAGSAEDVPDSSAVGFMPLNNNPSYSNLPYDTRWWLQMQPSYGYQKDLMYEQLGSLEDEIEIIKSSLSDSLSKQTSGLHVLNERDDIHNKKCELHGSMHSINSSVCAKPDHKVYEKEEDPLSCKNMQEFLDLVNPGENYEFVEMDTSDCKRTKVQNESCFDPVSPWLSSEKTVPWWRTTDKDELASLVAQKSLDYIENCDLPPPQKTNVRKFPYGNFQCFNRNDLSLEQKPETCYTSSAPIIHSQVSLDSLKTLKMASGEDGRAEHGFDESSSHSANQNNTPQTDASESDFSKAKLLEALCHSQTRAREAEKAVKQAYAEKEHVVKLFFKQASQLFAYKQWFQLLQLEALYHQIKNNEPPISTLIPSVLPWTPSKGKKLRKNLHKSTKGKRNKRGQPKLDVTKYAIAFALGLGLVGAGLLLGWTVGWMLPF